MQLDELRASLFTTTDGLVACNGINRLSQLANQGSDDAKNVLADYARGGPIDHHRTFACSCLASVIKEPHAGFAELFRHGLADSGLRYWSILGYVNSAGKSAYDELIRIAADANVPLAERAHAVKCLAASSKQKFDRGLPADPGFWKEEQLRLGELRAWATSGYPDGAGYVQPIRHPALDEPQTAFEKIVQKLDQKLAKQRKKQQDPAEPTNWLVIADTQDISRIKNRWELPATYLDFLTRFSPLRVIIQKRKFYNPMWLFGAGDLLEGQNGYSFDPVEKQPIADWPPHLVVIASHGGDPFVVDQSRSDGSDAPILTAEHGAGKWSFVPVADSFADFLQDLAK